MTHEAGSTIIGSIGVSLLLLAFLLNLFKFLRADSYPYTILNLVGSGLACYSSYLISFVPFVILEATWAVVSAIALVKRMFGHTGAPQDRAS